MGTRLRFRNATSDSVRWLSRCAEQPRRTHSPLKPREFTKTTRDLIPRISDLTNGRKRTLRATSKLPLPPLPLHSPEHIFTRISRTSNQAKQFRTCSLISVPPREAPGSSHLSAPSSRPPPSERRTNRCCGPSLSWRKFRTLRKQRAAPAADL